MHFMAVFLRSAQLKEIGNLMRVTAGLVAATLAGTVVYVGATAVRFGFSELSNVTSFAFLVVNIAGILSLVIGLPAHLLFSYIGWNQLWSYSLGGACIGLLGGWIVGEIFMEDAISGVAGAAAFWAIAGRVPQGNFQSD